MEYEDPAYMETINQLREERDGWKASAAIREQSGRVLFASCQIWIKRCDIAIAALKYLASDGPLSQDERKTTAIAALSEIAKIEASWHNPNFVRGET